MQRSPMRCGGYTKFTATPDYLPVTINYWLTDGRNGIPSLDQIHLPSAELIPPTKSSRELIGPLLINPTLQAVSFVISRHLAKVRCT